MRQGLVAWLLTGVLALVAFDAFETFKSTPDSGSVEVMSVTKDGAYPPPPTGN